MNLVRRITNRVLVRCDREKPKTSAERASIVRQEIQAEGYLEEKDITSITIDVAKEAIKIREERERKAS